MNFDGPQPFNVDLGAAEIADQTGAKSLAPPAPTVPYEIVQADPVGIEPAIYRATRADPPVVPYSIPPPGGVEAEPAVYSARRHGILVPRGLRR